MKVTSIGNIRRGKREVKMSETESPPTCPYCLRTNEALTGDGFPINGDLAICASCLQCSIIEIEPVFLLRKAKNEHERRDCRLALANIGRVSEEDSLS